MTQIDRRLAKLEAVAVPPAPPTIQVIWPDGRAGPIQPAPHGKWAGLVKIIIKYGEWRPAE